MIDDFDRCYRAIQSRDPRFDGWFVVAVRSTGIYCRPSCPAVTPKRRNVTFHPTAASAQAAGYRACKRCRPDASPGSPEWSARADLTARAMRLIADGVVDRDGVAGLASRLGYSERHVHRVMVAEVGAGPLAVARAQRAQTARLLIESTTLPFADVAFAAGFASIRQFNDVVRSVFDATPTQLRSRSAGAVSAARGVITLRLPFRAPLDAEAVLEFLAARAIPGVESGDRGSYRRSLSLPHGTAVAELTPRADHVRCSLQLEDLRDLAAAVQRCRRLLDLDADPVAVHEALSADPLLGAAVRRPPGQPVAGAVEGAGLGGRALVRELERNNIRPAVAIIGEPTGMGIIEGHKGCYEYTTEFFGLEGHGSNPGKGVNAVEYAARYVSRLLDLADALKARAPADSRFEPPWTTVQVGRIEGGTARNVIAGHCAVEWEMRPVAAEDAHFVKQDLQTYVDTVLLPSMHAVSPDCAIVTHTIGEVEGLKVVPQSEARAIVSELTGQRHADVVPFGTEAGLFQAAGISSIICGPGSIAQAHKPDEFVAIEQLAACLDMLEKLRLKLANQTGGCIVAQAHRSDG